MVNNDVVCDINNIVEDNNKERLMMMRKLTMREIILNFINLLVLPRLHREILCRIMWMAYYLD